MRLIRYKINLFAKPLSEYLLLILSRMMKILSLEAIITSDISFALLVFCRYYSYSGFKLEWFNGFNQEWKEDHVAMSGEWREQGWHEKYSVLSLHIVSLGHRSRQINGTIVSFGNASDGWPVVSNEHCSPMSMGRGHERYLQKISFFAKSGEYATTDGFFT